MTTILAWLYRLTNEAIEIGYAKDDQVAGDGGLRLSLTLKLPLCVRRMKCRHAKADGWCFRCERPVEAK